MYPKFRSWSICTLHKISRRNWISWVSVTVIRAMSIIIEGLKGKGFNCSIYGGNLSQT